MRFKQNEPVLTGLSSPVHLALPPRRRLNNSSSVSLLREERQLFSFRVPAQWSSESSWCDAVEERVPSCSSRVSITFQERFADVRVLVHRKLFSFPVNKTVEQQNDFYSWPPFPQPNRRRPGVVSVYVPSNPDRIEALYRVNKHFVQTSTLECDGWGS